jgi:hypothetical protein
MQYEVFGPFPMVRRNGLIDSDKKKHRAFWESIDNERPGLKGACGCYVFAIRAGKGIRPWYVGKTEAQGFLKECLGHHKLTYYNEALAETGRGTPILFLIAKVTKSRAQFAKPSKWGHGEIEFLEKLIISNALVRNGELKNRKDTKYLKEIFVPGYINERKGHPGRAASKLAVTLGV